MSEVGQAPPSGAEGLPVRPPSKPSRAPLVIWAVIAFFCLVTFATALAVYLWSREALSSNDLKRATAIKINYVLKGNQARSVVVNDPAELRALLDALTITDTRPGVRFPISTVGSSVEFTLPDGTVAQTTFFTPTEMGRTDWGMLTVEPDFYRKVNEIATRAAGRRIDVMRVDN